MDKDCFFPSDNGSIDFQEFCQMMTKRMNDHDDHQELLDAFQVQQE